MELKNLKYVFGDQEPPTGMRLKKKAAHLEKKLNYIIYKLDLALRIPSKYKEYTKYQKLGYILGFKLKLFCNTIKAKLYDYTEIYLK